MKKYIHVTSEDRQFLAKAFNVSSVTVWKALRLNRIRIPSVGSRRPPVSVVVL